MQYLKDEQYYVDFYDLLTIKGCLRTINYWRKVCNDKAKDESLNKEEKEKAASHALNWELFILEGEEYAKKQSSIKRWMDEGRIEQDTYDNTAEPKSIHCSNCGSLMHSTMKDLEHFPNEPLRVLFFFECSSCNGRKGVYDNGEERLPKPHLCSKCKTEASVARTRKGKVITSIITCPSCGFRETEMDDLEENDRDWEKKQREDKELLEKYRNEFCLSDEKGKERLEFLEAMKYANQVYNEEKRKYDDPVYQKSAQLKKLSIAELEKILSNLLEKESYIKFVLEKPEIGKYVIVPFTAQDSDLSRRSTKSVDNLRKLIKETIEETNWRLIGDNVDYRLGYVSGRLKGYEREDDLLEILGKKKKTESPESELDYEKRMKYGSHNLVQLFRVFGEHDGIENVRKRRLEKEPEGFFLNIDDGPYSCGICGTGHYGNEIWWNLDGLRCINCHKNIKDGVIPSIKSRHNNDGEWFDKSQVSYDYGVPPIRRTKLEKEGLLQPINLVNREGMIYFTLYLEKDNQNFLKKYPKKANWRPREVINTGNKEVTL
ncbi:MAG: hypothetical protein M1150_04290 [Patescibacteria group bacterium]|nr:hypothetical protein [Patescibacteria group bacterium]